MSDVVERLTQDLYDGMKEAVAPVYLLREAAAEITALRDKLATAIKERDECAETASRWALKLDAAEARALAAEAESDRLRRALGSMELACERLAALRSDSTYLCMIQDPGAEEALVLLDSARKAARQALKEQTP